MTKLQMDQVKSIPKSSIPQILIVNKVMLGSKETRFIERHLFQSQTTSKSLELREGEVQTKQGGSTSLKKT